MSAQPFDVRLAGLEGSYHQVRIDGLQWRMTALIVGTWITLMTSIIFFHR